MFQLELKLCSKIHPYYPSGASVHDYGMPAGVICWVSIVATSSEAIKITICPDIG
jgi:hypothetical protein